MKNNASDTMATPSMPLMWKVQIGAYIVAMVMCGISLSGFLIYCIGEYDARWLWLDFRVFGRTVSSVISDVAAISDVLVALVFLIFRKPFRENAIHIKKHLDKCRNAGYGKASQHREAPLNDCLTKRCRDQKYRQTYLE